MRFHEFFPESKNQPYTTDEVNDTSLANITAVLQKHCSDALKNMVEFPLWRGMSNKGPIAVLDPRTGTRKSANTTNQYTMIMDNSPYMKEYPKRSKSLVCSSNVSIASVYGHVYALFPVNRTKIAVVPENDLWDVRVYLKFTPEFSRRMTMEAINRLLQDLGANQNTYEELVQYTQTDEFAKILFRYVVENNGDYRQLVFKPGEIIPYIQAAIAPNVVMFELHSIDSFVKEKPASNECWFSSPCVAIAYDTYINWLDYYKRTTNV